MRLIISQNRTFVQTYAGPYQFYGSREHNTKSPFAVYKDFLPAQRGSERFEPWGMYSFLFEDTYKSLDLGSTPFDFELGTEDVAAITTLDAKTTSFFDHHAPERAKWLGTRKLDI